MFMNTAECLERSHCRGTVASEELPGMLRLRREVATLSCDRNNRPFPAIGVKVDQLVWSGMLYCIPI